MSSRYMNLLDFVQFMASPASHLLFIGLLLLYLLWLQWTNYYKYSIVIYHLSLNTHIITIVISLLVFIVQLICTGIDWYVSKVILVTTVALEGQGFQPYDLDKVEIVPRDTTETQDRGDGFAASSPLDDSTPSKKDPIKVDNSNQSSWSPFQWARNFGSDYAETKINNDPVNPTHKDTISKMSRTVIGGNIDGAMGPFPPEKLGIKDPNDNNQNVQVPFFSEERITDDGRTISIMCTNGQSVSNAANTVPEFVGNPPTLNPTEKWKVDTAHWMLSPYRSNCYVKIVESPIQLPVIEPNSPKTPTENNPHYQF